MHNKITVLYIVLVLLLTMCLVNCHKIFNFVNASEQNNLTQIDLTITNNTHGYNQIRNEEKTNMQPFMSRSSSERKKNKDDLFSRLLPMFIIPYLIQSAVLPMILMSMKAMLIKSFFVGKLAIILGIFNVLRSRNNDSFKEVENYESSGSGSHSSFGALNGIMNFGQENMEKNSKDIVKNYYGYNGNEEIGAWIHHRRSKF